MCLIQHVAMCLNLTNCLEEDSAASKMEVYFGYMICSSDQNNKLGCLEITGKYYLGVSL